MIKNDLREQGFSATYHYQKHWKITLIWVVLTLFMITATFFTKMGIDRIFRSGFKV